MAAGPARLIDEELMESISKGFLRYDLTRTYQVLTDTRTDGPATALSASGLPATGTVALLGSVPVYCVSRHPKRVDTDKTAKKWNIVTRWSNSTENFLRDVNGQPTTDPTQIVKEVDLDYQAFNEPIRNATMINVTQGPYDDPDLTLFSPPWLASSKGPICNSAGEVIYAERQSHFRRIMVAKYYRDWSSTFDDYIDKINDAEVVITQTDQDGTRATYTFAARTLRIDDVIKTDIWKDGKLFFKAGFVMSENKRTWIHSEVDRGQNQRVFVGQYKSDGTRWTAEQMANQNPPITPPWGLVPIKQDNVAVGEPRKLNGTGAPINVDNWYGETINKDSAIYVNYKVYEEADFSALNL